MRSIGAAYGLHGFSPLDRGERLEQRHLPLRRHLRRRLRRADEGGAGRRAVLLDGDEVATALPGRAEGEGERCAEWRRSAAGARREARMT